METSAGQITASKGLEIDTLEFEKDRYEIVLSPSDSKRVIKIPPWNNNGDEQIPPQDRNGQTQVPTAEGKFEKQTESVKSEKKKKPRSYTLYYAC